MDNEVIEEKEAKSFAERVLAFMKPPTAEVKEVSDDEIKAVADAAKSEFEPVIEGKDEEITALTASNKEMETELAELKAKNAKLEAKETSVDAKEDKIKSDKEEEPEYSSMAAWQLKKIQAKIGL